MRTKLCGVVLAGILACLAAPAWADEPVKAQPLELWVYLPTNMLVKANVTKAIALMERAAKAGYTGVYLTDSKFGRWDDLPAQYAKNVARVRQSAKDLKLTLVAAVTPIGYSESILGRDPNLAEGLSVVDAPFVVKGGRIVPAEDPLQIVNGDFEGGAKKEGTPAGWSFADKPGQICSLDGDVKHSGKFSLRMQDIGKLDPQNGHARVHQVLKVQPFRNFHVSAWVKTEGLEPADTRIAVLAGSAALNHADLPLEKTQDWKQVHIVFNSLEFTEVNFYLGVWGGKGGKLWWDDVRIEPAGLTNLIRRAGAPFTLNADDGKTAYVEGKDFDGAKDPKMGMVPWPGGYDVWHEPPVLTVPAGSRLTDGQKLLAGYCHTVIVYQDQVTACMSEPKLYDILAWQVQRVHANVKPDGYFMNHDEIRVGGYDRACAERKLTGGEILADNVRRCIDIIRKEDAGKPIYVWSDMFDPFHNAQPKGRYYLVKGDGPWSDSWKGLDKDVVIMNWNSDAKTRVDSLKHFAGLGCKQMLAGYYDGDPKSIGPWLKDAAAVGGLVGVMYTTWQNKYDALESFAQEVRKFQSRPAGGKQ